MNNGYSTMTKEQADAEIKRMKAVGKKIAASRESARAFLIEAGILEKSGKRLAAQYR